MKLNEYMNKKSELLTVARVTGLFYLGLAVTGIISYAVIRSQIYVDGNPAETLSHLLNKEALSRIGIATELALVVFQALTALWFYKLFKKTNSFAAISLTAFGLINATAILIATAFWLSAQNAAGIGDTASSIYNLFQIHDQIWLVSNLFFGLWLIPMGYLVRKAKMPKVLSWFLIYGGVLYVLSAFALVILPDQKFITDTITIPATIGEFWIIGYLLFKNPKTINT